jgi:hypothetical protein
VTRRSLRFWAASPQEVHPLSWFTGPLIPLTLGAASVVQAGATTVFFWNEWSSPPLQLAAVATFALAAVLTAAVTRVDRGGLRLGSGSVVVTIAIVGYGLSAWGAFNGAVPVQLWWAPTAVGAVLGSFSPFASARYMLVYAVGASTAVGAITAFVFGHGKVSALPLPLGSVIIALTPVAIGAIASVVFAVTLVGQTERLLAAPCDPDPDEPTIPVSPPAAAARVSAQTVPFLESIAAAGVITDADRTLAAQLARELRTELVSTSSRSWLDVLAHGTDLVVNDPARLADRMNEGQRVALRGLLQDMLGAAVVERESLLLELRDQDDGSTAVAFSMEVDLPEGRRVVMLAPYYLTLKDAVENLAWTNERSVTFTFRIRPE